MPPTFPRKRAPIPPTVTTVELRDEGQPPIVGCIQVSGEFRDLIFEFIETELLQIGWLLLAHGEPPTTGYKHSIQPGMPKHTQNDVGRNLIISLKYSSLEARELSQKT